MLWAIRYDICTHVRLHGICDIILSTSVHRISLREENAKRSEDTKTVGSSKTVILFRDEWLSYVPPQCSTPRWGVCANGLRPASRPVPPLTPSRGQYVGVNPHTPDIFLLCIVQLLCRVTYCVELGRSISCLTTSPPPDPPRRGVGVGVHLTHNCFS